jgi:hypothetical protein
MTDAIAPLHFPATLEQIKIMLSHPSYTVVSESNNSAQTEEEYIKTPAESKLKTISADLFEQITGNQPPQYIFETISPDELTTEFIDHFSNDKNFSAKQLFELFKTFNQQTGLMFRTGMTATAGVLYWRRFKSLYKKIFKQELTTIHFKNIIHSKNNKNFNKLQSVLHQFYVQTQFCAKELCAKDKFEYFIKQKIYKEDEIIPEILNEGDWLAAIDAIPEEKQNEIGLNLQHLINRSRYCFGLKDKKKTQVHALAPKYLREAGEDYDWRTIPIVTRQHQVEARNLAGTPVIVQLPKKNFAYYKAINIGLRDLKRRNLITSFQAQQYEKRVLNLAYISNSDSQLLGFKNLHKLLVKIHFNFGEAQDAGVPQVISYFSIQQADDVIQRLVQLAENLAIVSNGSPLAQELYQLSSLLQRAPLHYSEQQFNQWKDLVIEVIEEVTEDYFPFEQRQYLNEVDSVWFDTTTSGSDEDSEDGDIFAADVMFETIINESYDTGLFEQHAHAIQLFSQPLVDPSLRLLTATQEYQAFQARISYEINYTLEKCERIIGMYNFEFLRDRWCVLKLQPHSAVLLESVEQLFEDVCNEVRLLYGDAQVGSITNSLSIASKTVFSYFYRAITSPAQIANSACDIAEDIHQTTSGIATITKNIEKVTQGLLPIGDLMPLVSRFGADILLLVTIKKLAPSLFNYAALITVLKMIMSHKSWLELIAEIPQFLQEVAEESSLGRAESDIMDTLMNVISSSNFSSIGAKTIIALAGFKLFLTKFDKSIVSKFMTACDFTWKAERGLSALPKLFELVRTGLSKLSSIILEHQGISQVEQVLHSEKDDFMAWLDGCARWKDVSLLDQAAIDETLRLEVTNLCAKGDHFLKILNTPECPRELNTAFLVVYKNITETFRQISMIKDYKSNKFDPFSIYLVGKPGVGKTFIVSAMCNAIADLENYPSGPEARIYYRNVASQYYDGYHHQFAVLREDAFQIKSGNLAELELAEYIQTKGVNQVPVNMAHLEHKGKLYSSPLLLMTSNVAYPKPEACQDITAIWRRRDMLIYVDCVPEVLTNGKLDFIKLQDYQSTFTVEQLAYNQFPHLRFTVMDPVKESPNPTTLTNAKDWPHMRSELLNVWEAYRNRGKASLALLNNLAQPGKDWRIGVAECTDVACPDIMIPLSNCYKPDDHQAVKNLFQPNHFRTDINLITTTEDLTSDQQKLILHLSYLTRAQRMDWYRSSIVYPRPERSLFSPKDILDEIKDFLSEKWSRVKSFWQRINDFYSQFCLNHPILKVGLEAFFTTTAATMGIVLVGKLISYLFPSVNEPLYVYRSDLGVYMRVEGREYDTENRRHRKKLRNEAKSFKKSEDHDPMYSHIAKIAEAIDNDVDASDDFENEFLEYYCDIWEAEPEEMPEKKKAFNAMRKALSKAEGWRLLKQHYPEFFDIFENCYSQNPDHPLFKQFVSEGYDDKSVRPKPKAPQVMFTEGYDDKSVRPKNKTVNIKYVSEGTSDPNSLSLRNLILGNAYEVEVLNATTGAPLAKTKGVFVEERELLVPFHLVSICSPLVHKIRIRAPRAGENGFGVQREFFVTADNVTRIDDKDAAIIHCPVSVAPHRRITHHFPKDDVELKNKCDAELIIPTKDSYQITTTKAEKIQSIQEREDITGYTHRGTIYALQEGYWHYAPTEAGHCGSVLLAEDVMIPNKILGIHVAGHFRVNGGATTLVTQDMLARHMRKGIDQVEQVINAFGVAHSDLPSILVSGEQKFLGIATDGPHQSTQTAWRKSAIFDKVVEHTKEPAALSAHDERIEGEYTPLEMAFNKFAIQAHDPNPAVVEYIHKLDTTHDIKVLQPCDEDITKVSWDFVLQGKPTQDQNSVYFQSINMASSAGWPWNKKATKNEPGKHAYIDTTGERWSVKDNDLKQAVRQRIDCWINRKSYPSAWASQLKDEKRSISKVKNAETRLFTSGTLDFFLAAQIFTRHWVGAVHKNFQSPGSYSRVGIDMASYDATKLIQYHQEVSDQAIAGDHSDFDGQMMAVFAESVFEEIADWYEHHAKGRNFTIPTFTETGEETTIEITKEQFRNALYVCGSEVWSTTLFVGRNVFIKSGGNTSGNNLTVYINNKVNRKYMLLCWLYFCKSTNQPELCSQFDKYCRLSTYGDDLLLSVAPHLVSLGFDFYLIQKVLASFGLTFTAADKSLNPPPTQPLLETTFLKRSFRRDNEYPEIIVSMMDKETIAELTNWVQKSAFASPEEQLSENLDNSLRFAVYHGKAFYDEWLERINKALREVSLPEMKDIYHEERTLFLEKCGKGVNWFPGICGLDNNQSAELRPNASAFN